MMQKRAQHWRDGESLLPLLGGGSYLWPMPKKNGGHTATKDWGQDPKVVIWSQNPRSKGGDPRVEIQDPYGGDLRVEI